MKKGISNKTNAFWEKGKSVNFSDEKSTDTTKVVPLFTHKWKDATTTEIKEESIKAYKKFAF